MKRLFLSFFVACSSIAVSAQKTYFLYLQTDDQSPFYVRMADKIYSSSTAGYLILPNLTDSTYMIGVGFPKTTQAETRFAVAVNQNDKGYLLKNFPDGLSLFDIQDLSVVKSFSANKDNTVYETKTDKFSSVLSKAADDPSLLKVPVRKKEEPKVEPEKKEAVITRTEELKTKPEQKEPVAVQSDEAQRKETKAADSGIVKTSDMVQANIEQKEEPRKQPDQAMTGSAVKTEESKSASREESTGTTNTVIDYKPSVIVRRSESSTTEGFGIVYLDKMDDKTDTVRILVPPSKIKLDPDVPTTSNDETEKKPSATAGTEPLKTKANSAHDDSVASGAKEKAEAIPASDKNMNAISNSTCKELASDKDFMKLRKNMAAKSSDDDMIFEAKKAFRIRCFTSEQVRYLSTLFLTSAAKYQFFDTAYNFVSDKQNFAALQSEIRDEYFLKRFKALVGE